MPLHVIDGESGFINVGDTNGRNIYDFTFVDIQDMYTLYNFQVGSIPVLASRYPSNAHTFGEAPQKIEDNPVFFARNEVAILVNEELSAGEYEVEFVPESGTGYHASSVYFYQLVSSSYVNIRKMILMK